MALSSPMGFDAQSVRDARPDDLPALIELNAAWEHVTSPLSHEELSRLAPQSALFRVSEMNGVVAAFLLAFGPGVDYDSVNFRWFEQRYERFLYIDRVVVGLDFQRSGLGDALYAAAIAFARGREVPFVVCEVDVEPVNTASVAFHDKLGFVEVGRQRVSGGKKLVSLRQLPVG